MNYASVFKLAVAFVGVFLGAGFVSGQELWQFFACFGAWGFLGFLLSAALMFLVDYALLHAAKRVRTTNIGKLILSGDHPKLHALIDGMQCLLLFGILVIMIAGAAALLRDLTGLHPALCGAVFALAVLAAALFDLRGVVTVFSILVPITCALAVLMGLAILFRQDFHLEPAAGSFSALLPNWWISGITYAAYNLFGGIGILVSFSALLPDRKTIRRGLLLGALILIVLTFCILAAMVAVPASGRTELPSATLASQIHPVLGSMYNLLMCFGMFSSAMSSLVALLDQGSFHWPVFQTHRKLCLPIALLLASVLSLAGFGNLIGVIYPIFGYASIPLLGMLVWNWWKHRKEE